jgi:hypothetical protein
MRNAAFLRGRHNLSSSFSPQKGVAFTINEKRVMFLAIRHELDGAALIEFLEERLGENGSSLTLLALQGAWAAHRSHGMVAGFTKSKLQVHRS